MIACLDVHYSGNSANAACVAIQSWTDSLPLQTLHADVHEVAPYQPGNFYLRELPCLLAVLPKLPRLPDFVVVDGYVWISPAGKPGLGAHLHKKLDEGIPVIGVAKTAFNGMPESPLVASVLRGHSKNPLFVSSIGIELSKAAGFIESMHGPHRTPTILRLTDHLARGQPFH